MVMRRFAALLLVSLLSGCSALQGTPQPAPRLPITRRKFVVIRRKDYNEWVLFPRLFAVPRMMRKPQ
jgi:uncharacterized protein YceK